MNPSTLQQYLDTYDSLEQSSGLTPHQEGTLRTLRLLAKAKNEAIELDPQIQKIVGAHQSTTSWDEQTAFEKLMSVLGGGADKALFFTKQQALANTEQWLNDLLQSIAERVGGEVSITRTASGACNVKLSGSVLMKYAAFIKCAVKPRRLGRGYKAQSFKEGFVAVEYIV